MFQIFHLFMFVMPIAYLSFFTLKCVILVSTYSLSLYFTCSYSHGMYKVNDKIFYFYLSFAKKENICNLSLPRLIILQSFYTLTLTQVLTRNPKRFKAFYESQWTLERIGFTIIIHLGIKEGDLFCFVFFFLSHWEFPNHNATPHPKLIPL
jgi:hypothetical protein